MTLIKSNVKRRKASRRMEIRKEDGGTGADGGGGWVGEGRGGILRRGVIICCVQDVNEYRAGGGWAGGCWLGQADDLLLRRKSSEDITWRPSLVLKWRKTTVERFPLIPALAGGGGWGGSGG